MSDSLKTELETFEAKRQELLARGEGKFVLIQGSSVIGVYDTRADALNIGYEKFGAAPFLVKEIVQVDTPLNFTSFKIAALCR